MTLAGLDLAAGTFLLGIIVSVGVAAVVGRTSGFARVEQQGGSIFLPKPVMTAGYGLVDPLARGLAARGLSPAFVSWCSIAPALAAGWAAGSGLWGFAAWGLLASALLDVLDGAVARVRGTASPAGAILDSVLDRYAEFAFFLGLLVFYSGFLAAQVLVFVALAGSLLVTYSTAKAEALSLTPPRGMMKRSDRLAVLVVASALSPVSLRWFERGSAGWHPWPMSAALGAIALLANLSAIQRFLALSRAATSR